ncbi:MAG: HAMP domain-containing sensor histidine kinase [Acidobacteriota bacterium]|jgi:signal transduction histidine kinase
MRTLYAKLSVALFSLLLVLGTVTVVVTVYTSRMYMLEVQQRLHRDLAAKVIEEQPSLRDATARGQALDETFEKLMVINPEIEVYLLDDAGRILAYSAPPGRVRREKVDLGPVRTMMGGRAPLPILGTDPRNPSADDIFSVAALGGQEGGYLYIVLASEELDSVASTVAASYILRTGVFLVAGSLLLTLIGGLALFRGLTGRLRRLVVQMDEFEERMLGNGRIAAPGDDSSPSTGDEIDVLERNFTQMSARIARQLEQLEEQDKERRDLVTNISHDVRTPLTHLQGYLETMSLKGESLSADERREYLEIAVQRSEQLGRLFSDLLELAKLDDPGKLSVEEDFSMSELVQDVAQRFRLTARERGIELGLHIDSESTPVRGNLGAVERALENLIENAFCYSERGARVDVEVARHDELVEVEVRDTGPGVPAHELEHIFDRFYRCAARASSTEPGSGLGLSIAHRALELHGVDLACDSRVGEGTSFRFAFACR